MRASHDAGVTRGDPSDRLWDRQAVALVSVIFLTEAAIAVLFFSLVQQYPAHLLRVHGGGAAGHRFLRAGAEYAGFAMSAYGIAKLPGQPISGWLADRFGARKLLLIGLALCLVVVVAMSAVADVAVFIAACAAYGLAHAVVWPSAYALVGDFYSASKRGRLTAAISGAQLAGTALGFSGGALVIDHAGFVPAFNIALALNALAFFLAFGRERRISVPAAENNATGSSSQSRSLLRTLRCVLTPNLLLLSAIMVMVSLSVSILAPDLRVYSAAVLHLRFSVFALLLAIPAGAAVVTLIPSGMIADRLGRSVPMVVAAALWPLSMLALTWTQSPPLAMLFAAVGAFAYALGLPAWSASLIDLSVAGRRGLQVGLASAAQGVGLAVGPAIGGLAVASLGALAPLRFSAALMVIVLALSIAYRARTNAVYAVPQRGAAASS